MVKRGVNQNQNIKSDAITVRQKVILGENVLIDVERRNEKN